MLTTLEYVKFMYLLPRTFQIIVISFKEFREIFEFKIKKIQYLTCIILRRQIKLHNNEIQNKRHMFAIVQSGNYFFKLYSAFVGFFYKTFKLY